MFEQDQFIHWCRKLNFTERAEGLIQQIRSSGPARLVQSGRGNVCGRYPSRKMGVTIQFESHKNELARIQELEHASDVIEFYDQPPSIKIEYQSATGKKLGVLHTSDFFVIRETSAGWEECKMEEELDRLAEKNPNRYCRDESGQWRCPPGEAYASQFGFYYHVVSSAGINWVWQRNIIFLDEFLRADLPMVSESASTAVRLLLSIKDCARLRRISTSVTTSVPAFARNALRGSRAAASNSACVARYFRTLGNFLSRVYREVINAMIPPELCQSQRSSKKVVWIEALRKLSRMLASATG